MDWGHAGAGPHRAACVPAHKGDWHPWHPDCPTQHSLGTGLGLGETGSGWGHSGGGCRVVQPGVGWGTGWAGGVQVQRGPGGCLGQAWGWEARPRKGESGPEVCPAAPGRARPREGTVSRLKGPHLTGILARP